MSVCTLPVLSNILEVNLSMQVSDYFEEIFDKQQGGFHKGYIPVDTRRKLNVHKTFRRRPGRLLNVLCTFNLRPASTGIVTNNICQNVKKWKSSVDKGKVFGAMLTVYTLLQNVMDIVLVSQF